MYDGYLEFGGDEIINAERTAAYVANGTGPDGLQVTPCTGDCEDFHEVLLHEPYTSPILDKPPWYDANNPDSFDFAGLVPLEISGADGSTRTREVVARLGDGGIPTRGRAEPRTIGVSALAIARSECGLAAGISWLTAALHPPCVSTSLCGGTDLEGFSCCPAPFCPTQDPDAPLATTVWSGDYAFPVNGAWDTLTDTFRVSGVPVEVNYALNPNVDAASPLSTMALRATNLIPNPGFEANTTSWSVVNGTLVRSTTVAHTGAASALATQSAAGLLVSSVPMPVTAGKTYRGSVQVRSGAINSSTQIRVKFRDSGGATLSTVLGTLALMSPAAFQPQVVQGTAPAGAVTAVLEWNSPGGAANASWNIDSFQFVDAATWPGGFFDGATPDVAGQLDFAWTGTAGNSTSTVSTPAFTAVNLIPNPNFATGIAGWYAQGGVGSYVPGSSQFTYTRGGGPPGAPALIAQTVYGVVPGVEYRLTSRVMKPTAGVHLRSKLVFYSPDGVTELSRFDSAEYALSAGVFTSMTVTGTAPTGAGYVQVTVFETLDGVMPTGEVVVVDSVMLTAQHPEFAPYFDGSSPGAMWLGAANASASVLRVQAPTQWHSNNAFGGFSLGQVIQTNERAMANTYGESVLIPDTVRSPGFSAKLICPTDPALDCWMGVGFVEGALDPGVLYTFSCWVYVPTGQPDVVLSKVFGATGEVITIKDRWVYATLQWTVQDPPIQEFVGVRTATGGLGTTAGQHFYVDAAMVVKHGYVGVNGAEGSANVDFEHGVTGWFSTDAFGAATPVPAASITSSTEHFVDPSHSMKIEWPDLIPGTGSAGVWSWADGTDPLALWTFSCWVYVPSGSPDVRIDALFVSSGPWMSVKDQWVKMTHTSLPQSSGDIPFGIQTANPTVGGVVYVDRVRVSKGDRTFEFFDGDSEPSVQFYWTGAEDATPSVYAGPEGAVGLIATPILSCLTNFTASWRVDPLGENSVTVIPVAVDALGTTILLQGETTVIPGGSPGVTITWEAPQDAWESWRAGLLVSAPGAQIVLTTTMSEFLSIEDCIAPLRRGYRNVVTVAGPTVVEKIATANGETTLARLEWTWVAADPFQYGSAERIVQLVPSAVGDPAFIAKGVQLSNPAAIGQLLCPAPAPQLLLCTDDPCAPALTPPPAAVSVPDTSFPQPAGYNRRAIQVPPELVPAGLGVLTFIFHNDANDKVGVRVRIWEDPDPDFGNVTECNFINEFTIGYIAPDQSFNIDGDHSTITSTCAGIADPVNASRMVRGAYGGPFQPVVVGCGNRYHIAVDVPTTYPTTCSGFYVAGQPQGNLDWTVMLNRRDG